MPNIAIDVSPLNDGNSVRGVGFYTKHLVDAVKSETTSNPSYKKFNITLLTDKSQSKTGFDLIHYPYFDPFALTLPSQHNCPFIITIHDLIPCQFKKHYPVGFKGELKWLVQRYRAQQAKYIITDSHYSKYIVSDLIKYPVDQIYVTYLAADPVYKPINNRTLLNQIKSKYKLPDKFVLYVGDINWNKNIPNLVKSCNQLNIPLVIVGSSATKPAIVHPWTQDIIWLQDLCQTNPNIICTGFISDPELAVIYNLATIYCQPSFAEGFGLPVIEAMQSGTPVVYSQETSLPELMDFNGVHFDPYLDGDLTKKLKLLLNDSKLRQKYSKLGLKHTEIFDWKYTAIQTLAVYKLALLYGK